MSTPTARSSSALAFLLRREAREAAQEEAKAVILYAIAVLQRCCVLACETSDYYNILRYEDNFRKFQSVVAPLIFLSCSNSPNYLSTTVERFYKDFQRAVDSSIDSEDTIFTTYAGRNFLDFLCITSKYANYAIVWNYSEYPRIIEILKVKTKILADVF
jgi:hypothetical protein